ncbi:hypothetical protein TcasGA2_TC009055 [Tribolium castaneum]|uniref:Uncharacterized protein n=1 Tax=Tribolium castaneum TaxID=7070 RepID=D6WPK8_TRICA|nr:hypothetical protein TcasGA2_TC009055 [Tribolium castaneum]
MLQQLKICHLSCCGDESIDSYKNSCRGCPICCLYRRSRKILAEIHLNLRKLAHFPVALTQPRSLATPALPLCVNKSYMVDYLSGRVVKQTHKRKLRKSPAWPCRQETELIQQATGRKRYGLSRCLLPAEQIREKYARKLEKNNFRRTKRSVFIIIIMPPSKLGKTLIKRIYDCNLRQAVWTCGIPKRHALRDFRFRSDGATRSMSHDAKEAASKNHLREGRAKNQSPTEERQRISQTSCQQCSKFQVSTDKPGAVLLMPKFNSYRLRMFGWKTTLFASLVSRRR